MASISTNYLARAELRHVTHDSLLPGLRVFLGYSDRTHTGAPYDVDCALRLVGRKQSLTIDGELVIDEGRRLAPWMDDIDPFA